MDIGKEGKKMRSLMKETLFDVQVDAVTMDELIVVIDNKIKTDKPTHILGINADKINELRQDHSLQQIVQKAEIIHADGISMLLAANILNKNIPERIAGIDLMQHLLDLAESNQYTVYFLGAKQEVLDKMEEKILKKYPKLLIAGTRNGYFSDEEWPRIVEELRICKPQIVFVGITSPKKEYLIDYLLENRINTVFMGVGGSFDVLSGEIRRAPTWIQNCHLEWCFRMIQEPKRLFKRYFFGNIKFLKLTVKEKFTATIKK